MYVGEFKNGNTDQKDEKIDRFFAHEQKVAQKIEVPAEEKPSGRRFVDARMHWRAPEFEVHAQNKKLLLYIAFLFMVLISYAIYANSPIMAITFVLFGVVGYIHVGREPRILDFAITDDGIIAGQEIFRYENIKSFWIFYEVNGMKVVSLRLDSYVTPYIHIPVHDEDPIKIREILLENIQETKQEQNVVDALEKMLGM